MSFNTLFVSFFVLFFLSWAIVRRKSQSLNVLFVASLLVFLLVPDGLLSNGLKICYLVFFYVFGAYHRVPSSMAAFAVAYVGVYSATLTTTEISVPLGIVFLAVLLVFSFVVQTGGVFFDTRAKQFARTGKGGAFFTHVAHFEYLVFRAFPALLVLYGVMPFLRYRLYM